MNTDNLSTLELISPHDLPCALAMFAGLVAVLYAVYCLIMCVYHAVLSRSAKHKRKSVCTASFLHESPERLEKFMWSEKKNHESDSRKF